MASNHKRASSSFRAAHALRGVAQNVRRRDDFPARMTMRMLHIFLPETIAAQAVLEGNSH
jgi:hypothetical protein